MHVHAERFRVRAEPREIEIEVLDGVRADGATSLAPRIPIAQCLGALGLGRAKPIDGEAHGAAQELVAQRNRAAGLEVGCELGRQEGLPFSCARSTSSATCAVSTAIPRIFMRPAMLTRHPTSVLTR